MQRFEKIGKQREVIRGERRTVSVFRNTHSLVSFHDKIIDKFNDIDGRVRKHDFEKRFKHFQVCIERNLRVCGRAVLREYFIDMERIDAPFLCIAHVDDVPAQIPCKRQILGFGIKHNHSRAVRPFVSDERFKEIRFARTRLADDHGIAVLIQVSALP